jgi:hypothetical protein
VVLLDGIFDLLQNFDYELPLCQKKGLDNLLLAQKLSHYPLAQKREKPCTAHFILEESGPILLLWTTFYENESYVLVWVLECRNYNE